MTYEKNLNIYFMVGLIVFELLYWCIMVFTKSEMISAYFLSDVNDTAMDYFNMLANLQHLTPYENSANYSAIVF